MLISPPFLPSRPNNLTEDAWLDLAMPPSPQGHGKFPLSFNLGWHGGVHLEAPLENGSRLPVRAIADGTVVYVRQPISKNDNKEDPHNYGDMDGNAVWTDKGCVIIKHTTSIGANATGQESEITFFSVYMHLNKIRQAVQKNQKIYRKDEIGDAGIIYGETNQIHFEIICDDTNLQRIVGRGSGDLTTSQDGRADAVYGSIYFSLPSGTPVYAQQPLPHLTTASVIPQHPANTPAPAPRALQAASTTTENLVIEMQYANGSCIMTTVRQEQGNPENFEPIGTALTDNDFEYNIYTKATDIAKAYQKAHDQSPQQTSDVPAASAVYELLRFGRIINTANETLTPANVPHWRRINYPGGSGWVNFNATNVYKFSDADFPQWMGWTLVDNSTDQDSRCDSSKILGWIDTNKDGKATYLEALLELGAQDTQKKLGKVIAKFPSEWNATTIDQRWGWLKTSTAQNPQPLAEEDFGKFKAHANALCFWNEAGIGISDTHWHFHPVEFIRQFRKCGWLSRKEFVRCIPSMYRTETGARGTPQINASISLNTANQRATLRDHVVFMNLCRKYSCDSRQRLSHFFAQVYRETGVLRWSEERASGAEYEGRADLGNIQTGDGVRFKGRGLIQTTGRKNYKTYGQYRGRRGNAAFTVEPNNLILSTHPYEATDAAGLYWVSRNIGGHNLNINRLADSGTGEQHLRAVTRNVNGAEDGPWTGLLERRSHLKILCKVLLDGTENISPEKERRDV